MKDEFVSIKLVVCFFKVQNQTVYSFEMTA